jgi:hypothetical protein
MMEALAFLLFAAGCFVALHVFDELMHRRQMARRQHARPFSSFDAHIAQRLAKDPEFAKVYDLALKDEVAADRIYRRLLAEYMFR